MNQSLRYPHEVPPPPPIDTSFDNLLGRQIVRTHKKLLLDEVLKSLGQMKQIIHGGRIYDVGDTIDYTMPNGVCRIKIKSIN